VTARIVQIGYGKMGAAVAVDLLRTATFDELTIADVRPGLSDEVGRLGDTRVRAAALDVDNRRALLGLLDGASLVIELLPVSLSMKVAQAAVEAGVHMVSSVHIVDWSIEDPAVVRRQQDQLDEIDRRARAADLTVLKEFGMDPGLDLVVAGEAVRRLDEVDVLYTYGAGFPEHRLSQANPLGYKFTWSVVDTMYSYSIPSRFILRGEAVERPGREMFAPGTWHTLDLPELGGPLECFVNGDAESLARLFPSIAGTATSLGRFICRWPGHAALWDKLVKSGFVGKEPIEVGGASVVPAEFCAALLGSQEQFRYGEGERDVAIIRSDARGRRNGEPTRVIGQLLDWRNLDTGFTAMQRTVAFPISVGAQMILDGRIKQRGVLMPVDVPFEPLTAELAARGLHITWQESPWDGDPEPGC